MFRWWTYRLSDFLLFSAETYYRQFELYNQEIWPLQLLPLAAVAVALMVKIGPARKNRWTAFVLAASWLWVAWAYHLKRYATINWVAPGFATAFTAEAVLLFLFGVIGNRMRFQTQPSASKRAGLGLLGFAIVGQPLILLLTGRSWMQAELFGSAPDSTAIGMLGLLLLGANRRSWPLGIIPLLWCAVSAATHWALSSPGALRRSDIMKYTVITIYCALFLAVAGTVTGIALAQTDELSQEPSNSVPGRIEAFQLQFTPNGPGASGPFADDIKTIVPSVESLWLADADNDTLIDQISNGEIFYAGTLPANLTVVAQANDDTESVAFGLDAVISYQIENWVPYALAGDKSGDYVPADLSLGWHTVRARPYAADGATGSSGNEVLISFAIVEKFIEVDAPLDGHDTDPGDGRCVSAIDDFTPRTGQGDSGADRMLPATSESLSATTAQTADQRIFRRESACTLRAAIEEANARSGTQHIKVPWFVEDYKLTLGHLELTDSVIIEGVDDNYPVIDADADSRVFLIDTKGPGQTVFDHLILRNGYVSSGSVGGAVRINFENAIVTFTDVRIEDSTAGFRGGGINAWAEGDGTLNVINSRIEGNQSTGMNEECSAGGGDSGGGIYAAYSNVNVIQSMIRDNCGSNGGGIRLQRGANHLILRSTVSDNRSPDTGAGVLMEATDGRIEDSTISRNVVTNIFGYPEEIGNSGEYESKTGAGGIHLVQSEFTILSTTIAENENLYDADDGAGGLKAYNSPVTMRNTVLADNAELGFRECFGPIDSESGNFVGETNDDCDIAALPSDILDGGDPELGNLQYNGGLTRTMLPSTTSPLVDNGISGCEDIDQRGLSYPAPLGEACDIGAVEC